MFFVRTASERDLAKVSALLAETWHATYDSVYGADKVTEITAKWHSVQALAEKLKRKDAEFVVADDGKTIGGMGFAVMAKSEPKLAILDETDSGLDVDALKIVAHGVNSLRSPERAMLLVTHYERLLELIVPDRVHVLAGGRIVKSGPKELARELDERGYDWIAAGAPA